MKPFLSTRLRLNLGVGVLVLSAAALVFAATSDVDPVFNPILTKAITVNYWGEATLQPDGKWLIYGGYYNTNLSPGGNFYQRINADGTADTTFNCPACRGMGLSAVHADGKIIVSGPNKIIRVHADGSLDPTFSAPFNSTNPTCGARFMSALSSGKTLVLCDTSDPGNGNRQILKRLQTNGQPDPTFSEVVLTATPRQNVARMIVLPDGKILMGGGNAGGPNVGWINRYHPDGTLDGSFTATANGSIDGLGVFPDGRYLIVGSFSSVNGISKSRFARLFTDGSVDLPFSGALGSSDFPENVRMMSNGQFYVRTRHSYFPTPIEDSYRTVRYNNDGNIDNTFAQTFFNSTYFWEVDAQDRVVTFRGTLPATRYYRLNLDGSVDGTFTPSLKVPAGVSAVALQSDGKIVLAGDFDTANGVAHGRITKLNPDGSSDPTFNPGAGFDNYPANELAIQSDGKILAIGSFTGYNGIPRAYLLRVNADGSLDPFNPEVNGIIHAIKVLPNGKILIGGSFTMVNGFTRVAFACLNPDASLDLAFNPVFANNPTVYTISTQSDGKIMVGGSWGSVSGVSTSGMVRLLPDGTVDSDFRANQSRINQIVQRADGKYIVSMKNVSGNDPSELRRINPDGSRDFAFTSRGYTNIEEILVQPNGNIVLGGSFGIDRVGPNGEIDIFFPAFGTNGGVGEVLGQPDGRIIFAGGFSGIENVARSGIARLTLSNRIRGTLFDYDGDGRSDISVFRPSTNTWYEILSRDWSLGIQTFGASGDRIVPADYDADGKTDLGLFRPSIGDWLYIKSSTNTVVQQHFGQTGDIPLPQDVDGDGAFQLVIYRPSTGVWYIAPSGTLNFGIPGDQPVAGDFDGDGKADMAVFRPSTGDWWYAATSAQHQHRQIHWGAGGDLPVPADYDGDSKTDVAVFRPSDGGWYIYNSSNGSFTILAFGTVGDRPAPGDYDGDGRADIAIYRPSTGIWYLYMSTSGFAGLNFGIAEDIPTPNAFVP